MNTTDRLIRLHNIESRLAERMVRRMSSGEALYTQAWELAQQVRREIRIEAKARTDATFASR